MDKPKMKLWKKILIVILILLFIFIALTLRKVIILSNIDKSVTEYENNNTNIYIKSTVSNSKYTSSIQRFIKDDVDKLVIEKTDANGDITKIMQITYPTQRKFYTERDNVKVANVYKEEAPVRGTHIEGEYPATYSVIVNYAYSTNLLQRILSGIIIQIKTVEIDGKQCYELSDMFNSSLLYATDTKILVYVEKDTGLPVKAIEITEKDGKITENITTYKYEFDCVTDEDIKEPNISEYIVTENN